MLRSFVTLGASAAFMMSAAFAQDDMADDMAEEAAPPPEPVATLGDCALYSESPEMPDPKEATAEDRTAAIGEIKAYQAALGEYRACLDTISGNEELEVDARQAALDEFNRTVELETDMVKDWQKFSKKYDKANK
ncbi:hypothetical protein [Hyphococcus sp.]|uniref:hypothetical protein n=1 Tax=Hyphococcus sp. TaxID=2038636 RepID=UPI0035C6BECE